MPIVKMPDGVQVQFPDTMPADQIKGIIAAKFPESVPKPQAQTPSADNGGMVGTADAFGRGIAQVATFGFGDEIGAGARWLGGKVLPWQSNLTYDQALDEVRGSDKAVAKDHPVANIAGNLTGAVGSGVGLGRLGLSTTGALAGRGLPAMMAGSAVDGAIVGGAQGFGQGEGGFGNRLDSAGEGAKYGAALGALAPAVVSGVSSAVRRVITPTTSNPARQAMVDALGREGVDVTAGQATGNNTLRYAESEIGGQAAQDVMERQGEQFTRAALRRAGINADRATPDVIDDAFTRIGREFDDLGARNQVIPDRQLQTDLVDTWRDYMAMTPPNARAPVIHDTLEDLNNVFRAGPLDGAAYQAARSRIDRAARASAADPQLSEALRGIRSAIDDAMERSIIRTNPQDHGAFRRVRNQYRNILVLEQAATGAGENAAAGLISPSALRNATVTKQGRRNYARGNGDFAELSRSGEGVMKAMPQSGTAPRSAVRNMGAAVPALLGAGVGGASGGGMGAMAGAAVGAAAPHFIGRMMMSPTGQAYLRNQLLRGNLSPQARAAMVDVINQIDATFVPKIFGEERKPLELTVTRALGQP
jgi:hypothetical protein